MADELDALLARVDDEALRRDLIAQISKLRQKRQFGLVFEEHLPERVALPQHAMRRGTKVVRRGSEEDDPLVVLRVRGGEAVVAGPDGDETVAVDDLVAVADFGEPIYPGLKRIGSIDRGGDKPAHVVIKGENYHALEALQFTHAGKVDCIYIDPPYNTGARDWKYNNDYVDDNDAYRHSKWLAFMQRRLLLAKSLLNRERSCLVVSIDEKEYLRLGLLLQQVFPEADHQMVTSIISAKGAVRPGKFSRVEEHLFFVLFGAETIQPWDVNMLDVLETSDSAQEEGLDKPIEWLGLRRREPSSKRGSRPNQFYPIFVDPPTGHIVSIGEPVDDEVSIDSVATPLGTVALWPLRPNGAEMLWGLTPNVLRRNWEQGYAKVTSWKAQKLSGTVKYLPSGTIAAIEAGDIVVTGRAADGSVEGYSPWQGKSSTPPKRVWHMQSHNAELGGTRILSDLIPGRRFDYPKSVFAVEDTLRFLVESKPDALVLDFFAGSGTTAHAVARLNRQDGGSRRSISVTNNEVSDEEAKRLADDGNRPGDAEWEALGIFEHITRPRLEAAITGVTPEGEPVKGDYKFIDEFPMAEGFEENVEFVEFEYLDAEAVELDRAFEAIAPLLWMRAGSVGSVLTESHDRAGRRKPYVMSDHYAVLFNPDRWRTFVDKLPTSLTHVFVVTDSASDFANVAAELPDGVEVVRLYENYLSTFTINTGRTAP